MQEHDIRGYTLDYKEYIKEIDSDVLIYIHNKTKAKILYIAAEDEHKTFCIGFRTPPKDSTGVPHIIEHSVLCGSKKYPLKDPFVELAKGSLNTYLNAMTYPDKTVYPISSQNSKDFHNLMSVYLDAVFFPKIYEKKEILMQEGWRYHIESEEEPLEYKGVVYNEMKGAFSSPEEVLFRKIKQSLFPDTIYSHESGGDPSVIPDLTYEDFIEFHKKYYHPSNAYIFLYGNLDIKEELKFIDNEYLSHFEYKEIDSKIALQSPFDKPIYQKAYYSVTEERPNQLYISMNFVAGDAADRELMLALSILEYVLLETPGAPLKKALIQAGIGEDVFGIFQGSLRQPIFSIVAKNVAEDKKETFYRLVIETLTKLKKEGLPKELLEGALQVKEFNLREADSKGYSKGLLYSLSAIKSWIYDSSPIYYLQYEKDLAYIKENISNGYFEDIIDKYFLNNTHSSQVELYPKLGLDKAMDEEIKTKLFKIKSSWSKEELEKHIEETLKFKAFQEESDSLEAIHSIPLLEKKDLQKEVTYPRYETKVKDDNTYIITPVFTNKIAYVNWYIQLNGIENRYLPYLGMIVGMLGKLNTKKYTYEQLSAYIDKNIGGIEYHIQAIANVDQAKDYTPVFYVQTKALIGSINEQVEILREVIQNTLFEDEARILEVIKEIKSLLEMTISGEGHRIAYGRLLAHLSKSDAFEEQTKGLSFYHFVRDIEKNWSSKKDSVIKDLKAAYSYLANKKRLVVGLTVDHELVDSAVDVIAKEISKLNNEEVLDGHKEFESSTIQEALVYPGNVNYVAMGYNFTHLGYSYNGSLLMLKSILSMDYLWNKVRVQNGAYGCFCDFRRSGNMFMVSYRDPNIKKTMDIYKQTVQYIENLNLNERELLQYLIGTISSLDFPYTPSTEGKTAQVYYFVGITKEELQKARDELFSTTNETLRSFAPLIKECMEKDMYCVFGNNHSIEEVKDIFKEITCVQ